MEFVECGGQQRAVRRSDPACIFQLVIENEAQGTAWAGNGKSVGSSRGDDKQISGAGRSTTSDGGLNALAGKIEDELGVGVAVGSNLGVAVAVELKFAQDETQGVDFNLLNQQRAPSVHESRFGAIIRRFCANASGGIGVGYRTSFHAPVFNPQLL